jgi:Fe-S oxidoreductase
VIDKAKFPSGEPDGVTQVPPEEYGRRLQQTLEAYATRPVKAMMAACVDCGLCSQACHYYCSTGDPELIPAAKFKQLASLLRAHFHPLRSRLSLGARSAVAEAELARLFDAAFRNCTLCGKCALSCPMGINAGEILALGRILLSALGKAPAGLVKPVAESCRKGNYVGLSGADFVDNIEWIAEEMADEFEMEKVSIPIDKPDAEVLYVPHPLEVRDLPYLVMYALRILDASGVSYTLSSEHFDSVNYAYYQGSKTNMMRIAGRMIETAQKLGVKQVVLAPCGHGFRVMRWEAERYLGQKLPFSVHTITERVAEYIKTGRLKLKPGTIKERVTFHDPCNIARRGGVVQAPREVLHALGADLVEMHPHGVANYCCGGGGGLAATADFGNVRMSMGKTKADQIRRTGAKIVVTACFNCMTQIRSLNQQYNLDIATKSILELVAYGLADQTGTISR